MPLFENITDLIQALHRQKIFEWKDDEFSDLTVPCEQDDLQTFLQNLNDREAKLKELGVSIKPKLSQLIRRYKTMSGKGAKGTTGVKDKQQKGQSSGERGLAPTSSSSNSSALKVQGTKTTEAYRNPKGATMTAVGTGPPTTTKGTTKRQENPPPVDRYKFLSQSLGILKKALDEKSTDAVDFVCPDAQDNDLKGDMDALEKVRYGLQNRKAICEWLSSGIEKLLMSITENIDCDFKKGRPAGVNKSAENLERIKTEFQKRIDNNDMIKGWLDHIQQQLAQRPTASDPPQFQFSESLNAELVTKMKNTTTLIWNFISINSKGETEQKKIKEELDNCCEKIASATKTHETTKTTLKSKPDVKSTLMFLSEMAGSLINKLQAKEAELVKEKDNIKNMLDEKDKLTEQIKTMDERLKTNEADLESERRNITKLTNEKDEMSKTMAASEESQQTLHDLGIKIQDYNDALQSLQRMCTDEMRDTSKHDGKGQQKVSKSLIEPCDIQETVQAVKLKISGLTKEIQELRDKVASSILEIEKIGSTRGENASKTSRQMQDDVVCLLSHSIKGAQERVIDIKKRNDEEEAARRQQIQNCLENFKVIQETCQQNLQEREARSGRTAGRLKLKIDPENIESSGEYTINVLLRFSESYTDLLDRNGQLEKENNKAEKTISDLRYRLSKHMGADLMTDNPNIADLSDSNRPTKLAESFSELYDNEWTNAFEELQKMAKIGDTDAVKCLFDLLKISYEYCSESAEAQLKGLLVNTCTPAQYQIESTEKEGLPIDMVSKQAVNDLRKKTFAVASANLLKHSGTIIKRELQGKWGNACNNDFCQKYIKSCIEICWLMNIQSPPVYIDFELDKKGKFDDKMYKPYSKKGKKIDFVVWPPLYISKGGNLLAKGVAEGK